MLVCLQFESIGRLPDDVAAAHSDYERVTARRAAALENACAHGSSLGSLDLSAVCRSVTRGLHCWGEHGSSVGSRATRREVSAGAGANS